MPQSYYYSSVAGQFTLTVAATGGATILNVDTTTGMPTSLPFKLVLEPGTVREEIVKVTSVGGLALTVIRGWDGTPSTSHDAGTPIRHAVTAEDLTLARLHEAATTGVHGVTSGLVGLTDVQTITNKTFQPNITSATALSAKGLSGQSGDLVQALDSLGNVLAKIDATGNITAPNLTTKFATYDANVAAYNSHAGASSGVHGVAGSVVGTTDTQTLTNKTISGASNSLSAIPQSAVTGLVALASRAPKFIVAGTGTNVPQNTDYGVGNSWSITEGGTVVTGGVDNLTFAAEGYVILHARVYLPTTANRYAWIVTGGTEVSTAQAIGSSRDRFSLLYVGHVQAGTVLTFQQRQESGGAVNGATFTVNATFIPFA